MLYISQFILMLCTFITKWLFGVTCINTEKITTTNVSENKHIKSYESPYKTYLKYSNINYNFIILTEEDDDSGFGLYIFMD